MLATNVAESSLTVPGIRYVIDTGTARISRYSPRRKVQRLPIEPVSQASADQRAGRCGRVGPGICVRLYSEEDYLARDAYTTPEIQRTNLAAVILQTKAFRLGAIEEFPFLDPPRPEPIRDGYRTLFELGAIDDQGELTEIGRRLARLPVDPRIGRMILAAADEGCLPEVLIIAAVLEVQDPRERPVEKQEAADERHAQFADPSSDFLSYLRLWDFYHDLREKLSRNQLRKACQQNFLSFNRMREWLDIHRQLKQLVDESDLLPAGASRRAAARVPARGDTRAARRRRQPGLHFRPPADVELETVNLELTSLGGQSAGAADSQGGRIALRRDPPSLAGRSAVQCRAPHRSLRIHRRRQREVLSLARLGRVWREAGLDRGRRTGRDHEELRSHGGAGSIRFGSSRWPGTWSNARTINRTGAAPPARPWCTRKSPCSDCLSSSGGACRWGRSIRRPRGSCSSGTD